MMFLARLHGGGFFYLPKFLISTLWGLAYGVTLRNKVSVISIILVVSLTALLKSTGHGNFIDLGTCCNLGEPETLEFLINPLRSVLNDYWYDFTGLALIGFLGAIPYAIGVYKLNIKASLVVLIGGVLKSVAYALGWTISLHYPTEIGELLTGFFVGLSLFIAMKIS